MVATLLTMSVHPHVCGEYERVATYPDDETGSSPRVWGIRLQATNIRSHLRFIPTCVGNTGSIFRSCKNTAVHPHVCGEYITCLEDRFASHRFIPTCVGNTTSLEMMVPSINGSSPRVWGIRFCLAFSGGNHRFIPTCVGNTWSAPARKAMPTGSSPRVWGIPFLWSDIDGRRRFIPTCVGNTACNPWGSPARSVHPHVCGEYWQAVEWSRHPDRFIPTCVGNTAGGTPPAAPCAVHPHVCGEYLFKAWKSLVPVGSSPRVWGIR